jgi:transglutaminase-like putative cysteine protease
MHRLAREATPLPSIQFLAQTLRTPQAVEQYIRQNWRIVPDPPDAEYIRAPELQIEQAIETGVFSGDCDDAATLAAAILAALNWPASIIAIRMPGASEFSHVFLRAYTDEGFIDIDPIVPYEHLPIRNHAQELVIHV